MSTFDMENRVAGHVSPTESPVAVETPWGVSQWSQDIGNGIVVHKTNSHGGYFVPDGIAEQMPERYKGPAIVSDGGLWFEEDCAVHGVALSFPAVFPPHAQEMSTAAWNYWYGEQFGGALV